MDIQEVRLIGIAIAANYAACLESDNKFDFGEFGSDSIPNCYHYIKIIDDIIKIKPSYIIAIDKDKYWVKTEEFRWDIQKSLEREFTKENQK